MADKVSMGLSIENARIIFRNFNGKESQFNRAGDRNFCVIIEQADAKRLKKDGWNIKELRPRDEEDEPTSYLQVKVSFNAYPPNVWLVNKKGKTKLDEDTIGELDYLSIDHCDVSVRPYNWEVNGKSGVKAYLKTMYVVAEEDEFAYKYKSPEDDIPF